MAGFHFPRDPYFPDEGNNGWLDEEPEEDPEEGQEEDEEIEEGDSDAESEVSDPRFPIREHNAPPPLPSFQVYRHPGGPLWMRTPRKRVLPIHRPLLIEEPLQDPTPEWAERIRLWSRE
ncbi:hypothetical protein L1887_02065 [Cichorium endivia]|nr:hypothetical protein L1887_02065 [Cichorium endivia]